MKTLVVVANKLLAALPKAVVMAIVVAVHELLAASLIGDQSHALAQLAIGAGLIMGLRKHRWAEPPQQLFSRRDSRVLPFRQDPIKQDEDIHRMQRAA